MNGNDYREDIQIDEQKDREQVAPIVLSIPYRVAGIDHDFKGMVKTLEVHYKHGDKEQVLEGLNFKISITYNNGLHENLYFYNEPKWPNAEQLRFLGLVQVKSQYYQGHKSFSNIILIYRQRVQNLSRGYVIPAPKPVQEPQESYPIF